MAKLSYTAAEIDALLEKVATQGDDIEAIIAAFPFALQRGEYTLNDQSELTFDTLTDTKYYRYTASAIGNPVPGGYGIIINIRYTAYAAQLLFSQTTAAAPTQLLYRIGTGMNDTPAWKAWQTVSTGSGGGATIDTLWSDSSGATVGTEYTMAGNINDYDLICMKIGTPSDTQQSNLYTQLTFAVAGYTSGERISWEGYFKRYCHMSFSGDKFTVVTSGADNEASGYKPTVYEIIGIKY